MTMTRLQFRLEHACKETVGDFSFKNEVAVCRLGKISVSIDEEDMVKLRPPPASVRFPATMVDNIYIKGPHKGKGILIESKHLRAEVHRDDWYVATRLMVG